MKVLMYNVAMNEDVEPADWYNADRYDLDRDDFDDPIVNIDRETGEEYIVNPAGTIIYL